MRLGLNFIACVLLLQLLSCSVEPQPIEYGADECHRCKMIISQKQFGAQLVTTKGRAYKYDAIECLIPVLLEHGEDHYSHILVTDYHTPGQLIAAHEASYLISEGLPSPMGGNLSAYDSKQQAIAAADQYQGKVYDWSGIKANFE